MNEIIAPQKTADTQTFVVTGDFFLYASGFAPGESARLQMPLKTGGDPEDVRNLAGQIFVGYAPNIVLVESLPGTLTIHKPETKGDATVSFANKE